MIGSFNGVPVINKEEVAAWKWMKPEAIRSDIQKSPEAYTAWFKIIFEKFYDHLIQNRQL
jgi:isopentenyl-diphosphate delta-isomerase